MKIVHSGNEYQGRAQLDRVAGILFHYENANFAINPNLQVSLMGYQINFLVLVAGVILNIGNWQQVFSYRL